MFYVRLIAFISYGFAMGAAGLHYDAVACWVGLLFTVILWTIGYIEGGNA